MARRRYRTSSRIRLSPEATQSTVPNRTRAAHSSVASRMKRAAKAAAARAAAEARRVVAIIRRILTIAVILLFVLWLTSVSAVVMWSLRDEARPAQAIVVLGAAQYAGKPSPVLRARLDHALDPAWRARRVMVFRRIALLPGRQSPGPALPRHASSTSRQPRPRSARERTIGSPQSSKSA